MRKTKLTDEERDDITQRIRFTDRLEDLSGCDLVVEAVVEDLGREDRDLRGLDKIVRSGCTISSNTSSLPIMQLAAATDWPERVIGLHFFNPAPVMPLVEIFRASFRRMKP